MVLKGNILLVIEYFTLEGCCSPESRFSVLSLWEGVEILQAIFRAITGIL